MRTMDYGNWSDIAGQDFTYSLSASLEGCTPTTESLAAIESAWRAAIDAAMPENVHLHGELLIGPADGDPDNARADLREWLAGDGHAAWNAILAEHLVCVGEAPAMPVVVYLVGAGRDSRTWKRVESAMWSRGWPTIRARAEAWHLARGRARVVLVDFTSDEPTAVVGLLARPKWVEHETVAIIDGVRRMFRHRDIGELTPGDTPGVVDMPDDDQLAWALADLVDEALESGS